MSVEVGDYRLPDGRLVRVEGISLDSKTGDICVVWRRIDLLRWHTSVHDWKGERIDGALQDGYVDRTQESGG